MKDAVNLSDVRKSFGDVRAVDGLSLTIRPGETVALLGPNGAGKSTTIGLLLGLSTLDSGRIELFGTSAMRALRSDDSDATVAALVHSGRSFANLEANGAGLEEAFLAFTGTGVA